MNEREPGFQENLRNQSQPLCDTIDRCDQDLVQARGSIVVACGTAARCRAAARWAQLSGDSRSISSNRSFSLFSCNLSHLFRMHACARSTGILTAIADLRVLNSSVPAFCTRIVLQRHNAAAPPGLVLVFFSPNECLGDERDAEVGKVFFSEILVVD